MSKHALDTELDTPASDWFLDKYNVPAISLVDYNKSYANERKWASHKLAGFWDNRGWGVYNLYRDAEWELPLQYSGRCETFTDLCNRATHSISNSYGYIQNRALKILEEAYEMNPTIWLYLAD